MAQATTITPEPENEKEKIHWPYKAGFETFHSETTPVELKIQGKIPDYCSGVLYRTGPSGLKIPLPNGSTTHFTHWFDSLAQTHRFNLSPSRVTYNSLHTSSTLLHRIQSTGIISIDFSFAESSDPCRNLFRKFSSLFFPSPIGPSDPASANIGVTVHHNPPGFPPTAKDGSTRSLYTATDAYIYQGLDPETLEPISVARQTALHPELKGPLSSAHSQTDQTTGEVFNYNLTLGWRAVYKVFCTNNKGETRILAEIKDAPAAYVHSFWLTENFVVLCCFSAHYQAGGAGVLWWNNIIDALQDVQADKKAVWYVIPRTGGSYKRYQGEAFFAFHTANAWEENGGIVAEVAGFRGIGVLKKFYVNVLLDEKEAEKWVHKDRPRFGRWFLEGVETQGEGRVERVWEQPEDISFEMPTFNPRFGGRKSRYTYGLLSSHAVVADGIIKFDTMEGKHLKWEVQGHSPSEAVFVVNPDGKEEDDGVLLSVVLDGHKGTSYLLVLDARTMKEVARAEMNTVVPFGFHGSFVDQKSVEGEIYPVNTMDM
ncbi:Similar to Retinoid isomerohydrolase; acc. no. Q91ZQ5 [Pyronema omphalodes CBS 100304]|uniref:Similar to Retinoid isomerohydrolase acc. no. Q91ZQ5 n=1 Tax=Pyronema omphalodes (strain CBS 100304) TaxID=1076935 RepID=U4LM62_PYROM|nr:Similar to Retinoid isomerohydrolase; acc. no. Q91ZQ5 [Pyronema omphalodes CBS 100304]